MSINGPLGADLFKYRKGRPRVHDPRHGVIAPRIHKGHRYAGEGLGPQSQAPVTEYDPVHAFYTQFHADYVSQLMPDYEPYMPSEFHARTPFLRQSPIERDFQPKPSGYQQLTQDEFETLMRETIEANRLEPLEEPDDVSLFHFEDLANDLDVIQPETPETPETPEPQEPQDAATLDDLVDQLMPDQPELLEDDPFMNLMQPPPMFPGY